MNFKSTQSIVSYEIIGFPASPSVIDSVKNALSCGILSFNPIYAQIMVGTSIWNVEQVLSACIFCWFTHFFSTGIKSNFNANFQQSRSYYGSNYESSGQPMFSAICSLFACFRIIIIDKPSSNEMLANLLNSYGFIQTQTGCFKVTPLEFLILSIGTFSAGIHRSSTFITSFLSSSTTCTWRNKIYNISDLLNPQSSLYKYWDLKTAYLTASMLKQIINVKDYPNATISFFSILDLLSPSILYPHVSVWSRFCNHTPSQGENCINTRTIYPNSFTSPFSTLVLSCVTQFSKIDMSEMKYGFMPNFQSMSLQARELLSLCLQPVTSVSSTNLSSSLSIKPNHVYHEMSPADYYMIANGQMTFGTTSFWFGFSVDRILPVSTQDRRTRRSAYVSKARNSSNTPSSDPSYPNSNLPDNIDVPIPRPNIPDPLDDKSSNFKTVVLSEISFINKRLVDIMTLINKNKNLMVNDATLNFGVG